MKYVLMKVFFLGMIFFTTLPAQEIQKEIAVTFDDLPLSHASMYNSADAKLLTEKIIGNIKLFEVHAVGFVNENKLYFEETELLPERVDMLKQWLDAGLELGNHTFAHKSANKVSLDEFEEDIVRGENTIKKLLVERNLPLRYFRHPFLHTGRTLGKRDSINTFLTNRGYTIAPVTIDNSEWIYCVAYERACKSGDSTLIKKVGEEYVEYMKSKIEYFEGRSLELFGRNIKHVLLVHANQINADWFDDLCDTIIDMDYKFITLEDALKDDAYKSSDTFTGASGISWIDRWALTAGKTKEFFQGEPRVPKHILDLSGIDSE
ncbi:MAG: polysaccharide deacetylase family protein [bacterium]